MKDFLSYYLPIICTVLDALSLPATLSTVHVYRAVSSLLLSLISKELSSWMLYLSSFTIFLPSFVHVTVGIGTPLALHRMVTLVLITAVTLSPMVVTMGLWSVDSIVFGWSGISIVGLAGSVLIQRMKLVCWKKITINIQLSGYIITYQ